MPQAERPKGIGFIIIIPTPDISYSGLKAPPS